MTAAEIFDRGYRKYDGQRAGLGGAMRSLTWHTTRSILGLGRPARHKVFPIIVIVIAFLPAIIFIGIAALFPVDLFEGEIIPPFYELAQSSWLSIILFSAMVVPEALVRDRRDGMYALYLSTPLTRATYLLGKIGAVLGTLAIVTAGPALLMLLGFTFEGAGPEGFVNWTKTAAQIVLGGVGITVVFAAVSLAAASLTDRRAFASVAVILVLLGSPAVSSALVEGADMTERLEAFNVILIALEAAPRAFGERSEDLGTMSNSLFALSTTGWIGGSAALVWGRYRRLGAV